MARKLYVPGAELYQRLGYKTFGLLQETTPRHMDGGVPDQVSLNCISGRVGCARQARSTFCRTGLRTTRMNGLRKSARRGASIRFPSDVPRKQACDTRSM